MSNTEETGLILSPGQFFMPLQWNPFMFCNFINPYFANGSTAPLDQSQQFFYSVPQTPKILDSFVSMGSRRQNKQENLQGIQQLNSLKKCSKIKETFVKVIRDKGVESNRHGLQTTKLIEFDPQIASLENLNEFGKCNWTIQEQQKLKQLVNLFGKRWKYISQHFPERTGKQIRERYLNYLRPNLSLKKWTKEQDELILALVVKHGRSWRTIQRKLKNRSQNQIKNRFYGHLQKLTRGQRTQIDIGNQSHLKKQQLKTEISIAIDADSINRGQVQA